MVAKIYGAFQQKTIGFKKKKQEKRKRQRNNIRRI